MKQFTYRNDTQIQGNVIDSNDDFLSIEFDLGMGEMDVVNWEKQFTTVEDIKEESAVSKMEQELDNWLSEQGIEAEGFGDSNSVAYEIEGFTYNVSVVLTEDVLFAETTHNGRLYETDVEEATANAKEYKTLKGIKNFILRWTDK